ncbi:MAG TPA: rRNA maturation RNase YbeY, partial [Candidatus Binatia bacterium]|nr:rRNA maturation RNase YbeY [Candidatus Binatia bacterium]
MVILQKKVAGLSEPSLSRFVWRARQTAGLRGAVNVLVSTSSAMRSLNLQFRGKNKPTDVLSFPAPAIPANGTKPFGGEIAISAEIAAQNAA